MLFRFCLHQLPPAAHQAKTGGMVKQSRKCCGSYLTQRESGNRIGDNAPLPQHLRRRKLYGKQAGLGVCGFFQFLCCAGKALPDGSGTKCFTQIEDFPGGGIGFVKLLSHAGELVSLPGKDEG